MSALVKLSTKLPGDPETNGVDALALQLVDHPDDLRCAVVWFDTAKVTIDTDSGDHVPTIRLRRIEPIGNVGDVDEGIRAAVEAAVEKRTGRKAIPFGIVEVAEDGAYGDPQQLSIEDVKEAVGEPPTEVVVASEQATMTPAGPVEPGPGAAGDPFAAPEIVEE